MVGKRSCENEMECSDAECSLFEPETFTLRQDNMKSLSISSESLQFMRKNYKISQNVLLSSTSGENSLPDYTALNLCYVTSDKSDPEIEILEETECQGSPRGFPAPELIEFSYFDGKRLSSSPTHELDSLSRLMTFSLNYGSARTKFQNNPRMFLNTYTKCLSIFFQCFLSRNKIKIDENCPNFVRGIIEPFFIYAVHQFEPSSCSWPRLESKSCSFPPTDWSKFQKFFTNDDTIFAVELFIAKYCRILSDVKVTLLLMILRFLNSQDYTDGKAEHLAALFNKYIRVLEDYILPSQSETVKEIGRDSYQLYLMCSKKHCIMHLTVED